MHGSVDGLGAIITGCSIYFYNLFLRPMAKLQYFATCRDLKLVQGIRMKRVFARRVEACIRSALLHWVLTRERLDGLNRARG